MISWSEMPDLRALDAFYVSLRERPDVITDEEVLKRVRSAFLPTNCWAFVECSFAVVAPACALRSHLTKQLVEATIRAMVYGGLEDESLVVAQGVAVATKSNPDVEVTPEGRAWLLNEWPKHEEMARQVFREIRDE